MRHPPTRGHIRCPRRVACSLALLSLSACGSATDVGGETDRPAPTPRQSATELRALSAQANQLLDGGPSAFKARLADLRGRPVVVNQWASWCGPCRFEFPFFQRLARKYEGRVAFLGVNSKDNRDDARDFLAELPLPFPSYYDKDAKIAAVFRGGRAFPTTAFYRRSGKLARTHLGAYASEAKLDEDIRNFALR